MRWLLAQILGNLGYVDDGIWRSAQRWYLYPVWACLGLKTIINVAHYPAKDWHDRFEEKFCKWLGIAYVAFDNLGPDYHFEEALTMLLLSKRPILVHCEGGKDRTGGLIAYYKRTIMGRTWSEIVRDWRIYGIPGENWLQFLFDRR